MAKKKKEIFLEIQTQREFEYILNRNQDKLICAEIYSSFVGPCTALDRLFTTIKLDWSDGQIVLLKVMADDISQLMRFRDQSQPFFVFIVNNKITRVFRGVDNLKFADVARQELDYFKKMQEGLTDERPTYDLDEATPEEQAWYEAIAIEKEMEATAAATRKAKRQAARKRHRAELMVPHLKHLNFVLYWPHAKHAHPELYEKWDMHNIIMVGREEIQLTLEKAKDILYAGDAAMNEASMHALLAAPALAICFRLLDTDKHFVSLVRWILYEDIPKYDESKPSKDQPQQKTAFDLYKTYSPTREEVWQKRKEERMRKREITLEKRARRLSEMQRLARQAIEEAIQAKRMQKEQKKLLLLKTGNLEALKKLNEEPDDDEVSIIVPEELPEDIEEESEEEDDENEYFPPPGLLIPAFYSPPSDVAKANGLAILFPKLVLEHVTPEPEFLPPHVLVMLSISKRQKAIAALQKYLKYVIHMGVFKATTPYNAEHLAYTIKQFEELGIPEEQDTKLVLMISTSIDLPLLQLMDLSPEHVSRGDDAGEEESAIVFPVGYGDQYNQFEDFDTT